MRRIRDWFALKGFAVVLSLMGTVIAAQAQQPPSNKPTDALARPTRSAHPAGTTQGSRGYVVTPQSGKATAELVDGGHQPIGFTGYIKDIESGLYYANARYYDPRVGRFLTQDPAAGNPMQPPSLHRYLYAYANPATYTDSTGRQVDIEDPSRAAIALGWNDQEYADAVRVDTAGREVSSGSFLGASKQVIGGVVDFGKWGARLLGKTLLDIGDAKDVVDPVVRTIRATADAIEAGPVGVVETEARKSAASRALVEQDRTVEAGELYGPEVAMAIGAGAAIGRIDSLSAGVAERGAAASIVVEGASGGVAFKRTTLASSNADGFIGPTIGKSGLKSWNEFNAEAYRKYQQYVNEAYDVAAQADADGLLRGNRNTRVGNFVDQNSRADMRAWLESEGISEGPNDSVKLNRWLRNPAGAGYVRPDVQIPGLIMDATVGKKAPGSRQIERNAEYSGGTPTTVVRPSQLGGSCTVLPCPGD